MLRLYRPPGRAMLAYRVACRQQFLHTGDESHLLGIAQPTQGLIERRDCQGVAGSLRW